MLYFSFGFLTVIALIFICVFIVGIIKIFRLKKEVDNQKETLRHEFEWFSRSLHEKERDWRESLDSVHRNIDRITQETINYIDKKIEKTNKQKKRKMILIPSSDGIFL